MPLDKLLDKDCLDDALREMGTRHLKKPWKERWDSERPRNGFCYPVAEVMYHYITPEGSKPHCLKMEEGTHWYLVAPDGEIIDPVAEHCDEEFRYEQGKQQNFMTSAPSKRALILAELLALE